MKHLSRKRPIATSLALCLLFSAPLFGLAQTSEAPGPPNVLVIDREFLKPGKAGALHEKSESAFVRASIGAKSNSHYFGMDSLSGPPRSLFFYPYASFEAWEKDTQGVRKNTTFNTAMDHASNTDGELLSAYEQSAFSFRPDLSYNTGPLVGQRYMEITQVVIRPGHNEEVEELARLYLDGFKKAMPTSNSAAFELMYGSSIGPEFLFITSFKSLSEVDRETGDMMKFMEVLGEKGRKRLAELTVSAIESNQTNIFELNPKISYPPEQFIQGEPGFWKPQSAASEKPATKPTP